MADLPRVIRTLVSPTAAHRLASIAPINWAIFPIETYVFAFGSSNVSIVRMRVEIGPYGAIPGNYGSQVVWNGSVQQWNEKVMALNERAKTLNLGPGGNACVNAVTECEAQRINVVFHDRLPATPLP